MKNTRPEIVIMASREELSNPHYYIRLWMAARAEEYSRREWLNAMAATIYDYRGAIIMPEYGIQVVPEIDDVFSDGDNRWMSMYLENDPSKEEPRRYCLRSYSKLQLIDLYFRIKKPNVARHFGR